MRESWGPSNPEGAMKVKAALGWPRQDPVVKAGALPARLDSGAVVRGSRSSTRRSKSVHVGTRKMVNYA